MKDRRYIRALAALFVAALLIPAVSLAEGQWEGEGCEDTPSQAPQGGFVPPLPVTASVGSDVNNPYNLIPNLQTPAEVSTSPQRIVNTEGLPVGFQFLVDLKIGSIKIDVKYLQIFLNNNGFPIVATGLGSKGDEVVVFGPKTRDALMKFQAANGLTATGALDAATRASINGMISH